MALIKRKISYRKGARWEGEIGDKVRRLRNTTSHGDVKYNIGYGIVKELNRHDPKT